MSTRSRPLDILAVVPMPGISEVLVLDQLFVSLEVNVGTSVELNMSLAELGLGGVSVGWPMGEIDG